MRWVLGALLMLIVPSLLATGADSPGAVALTVVALAVVTLALLSVGGDVLASRALVAVRVAGDRVPPTPTGRVTDPTHHPLRPRAPGSA